LNARCFMCYFPPQRLLRWGTTGNQRPDSRHKRAAGSMAQ